MNETHRPRRILRSIGAVVAGVIVVIILHIGTDMVLEATGVFALLRQRTGDGLFVIATAYRTIYCVAAGYITARLAPDRPVPHAVALGVVGLAVSVAGAVATWGQEELGPKWYPVALVVLAVPSTWAGGQLYRMRGDGGDHP